MAESWKWQAVARLHKLHNKTPIPWGVFTALFGDYNAPYPPRVPQVWIASQSLAMKVTGPWEAEVISPPNEVRSLKQWATSSQHRPEEFAYLAAWAEELPGYVSWRVDWDGIITQYYPVIQVSAFEATVAVIRAAPKSAVLEIIGGGKYPLSPPRPFSPPEVGAPEGRASYWEDALAALILGRKVGHLAPDPDRWAPILSALGELQRHKGDSHLGKVATNILAAC
jgi:hypothetical protein